MKPGVATEFRKNLHSRVFLRSGQACTLPPGVAIHKNMQYDVSQARSISRAFTEVETGIVSADFADSN